MLRMISNRDLFANLTAATDFTGILQSAQFRKQREQTVIQDAFVMIELLFMALVRLPPHPLWLRRKTPFIGIELANRTQPRIDFGLSVMSATVAIQKL